MIKIGLYSAVLLQKGPASNKMLTFVTDATKNRQLFHFTCFIIHVGLECIGEKAYA